MTHGEGGFARAVREAARMRPAVMAGALGAVIACSAAFGAMAAEAPHEAGASVQVDAEAATGTARTDSQIFLAGLNAIAGADLSGMSPREAVSTLKAMARATLEAHPGFAPAPPGRGRAGVVQANVAGMADFLGRISGQPLITAAVAQADASALARRVGADASLAGLDLGVREFRFEGVLAEVGRSVATKRGSLAEIARLAGGPDADVDGLVQMALEGQGERAPGERAYLQRMVTHALADPAGDPEGKAAAVSGLAMDATADGFLGRIAEMWREQGAELDAGQVRQVALSGVKTLDDLAALARAAPAAPAPGR